MFAILFSDAMDPFYNNIFSFPTAVFTFLLCFCIVFWLISLLGVVDIDIFDLDLPDPDGDIGASGVVAGLLMKLGLYGVPITVIVTLVSFFGWIISFLLVYLTFGFLPFDWLSYVAGIPVLLISLYGACFITGKIIVRIRKFFPKAEQETVKTVLGQVATVRTTRVDKGFGEAYLDDGGAGLIVKVRATGEDIFEKGDRVVLLEYMANTHTYRVISEEEFNGS